ncbi:hypothetical protein GGR56DRAFT_50615 [Xylariaceae sp. FL0804]|nr:hypothetical protein GGR56DRAFT_50615 [Xylariaceae sp. FL0804]
MHAPKTISMAVLAAGSLAAATTPTPIATGVEPTTTTADCADLYKSVTKHQPTPTGQLGAYLSAAAATVTTYEPFNGLNLCPLSTGLPASLASSFSDFMPSLQSFASKSSSEILAFADGCAASGNGAQSASWTSFVASLATASAPYCTGVDKDSGGNSTALATAPAPTETSAGGADTAAATTTTASTTSSESNAAVARPTGVMAGGAAAAAAVGLVAAAIL